MSAYARFRAWLGPWCSVGLHAVVALAVGQRKREIGIRVALSAKPQQVVSMFFSGGLRLSVAGLAIGLPLSGAAVKIMITAVAVLRIDVLASPCTLHLAQRDSESEPVIIENSIVPPFILAGLFALGSLNAAGAQVNDSFTLYKSDIEEANPVQFLLQRGKPLALTDVQKDSLKAIAKGLDNAEKPVWKEMSALFRQEKALAGRGGGPVTIQVERMGSAGSVNIPNASRPVRTLPPSVRQAQVGLDSTRSVFRQRAWSQLNDTQRHAADSLYIILINDLDREAKANWKQDE